MRSSGGRYTVAHKDASVLERIASRQHRRAQRVRNPHEVFVELEEIHADDPNKDPEWEETARSGPSLNSSPLLGSPWSHDMGAPPSLCLS